ncbi:MAG: response regulator [Chitinophagales bacterium]
MNHLKTILLIEDNEDVRENTAEILELANYHVLTATNGKEGVMKAKEHLPDLIICDIMMPELDGYGVLHILSHDAKTATLPFIFLTAKTEKNDLRKGMNMGADDYITKPFEELDLLDTIKRRLEKADMLVQKYDDTEDAVFRGFYNPQKVREILQTIADEHKKLSVSTKYMLFHEDSYPCYLYYIIQGRVKTYKTNEDGKEIISAIYQTGDFFGYRSLFGDRKYEGSAMSLEDSEIVLIPKTIFLELVNKNQHIAKFFITLLTNSLEQQEKRLLNLAYDSVRKRVTDALLHFCKQYAPDNFKENQRISLDISREDLANWVGTSKETLIRTLSDLKQEKIIVTKGRYITVLNQAKL